MILTLPTVSLKSYIENPYPVLEIVRLCPLCETRVLSRHGEVERWVYQVALNQKITIFRLRCRPCGVTVTLLPDFLLPFGRYATAVVEAAVELYLAGTGSYRKVALTLAHAVVPEEVLQFSTPTEAIDDLCLEPGYQLIHAWVARVAARAVSDVQVAAAWATTRVPTSTVVDHQTTPLTPTQTGRTQSPAKRAGLDAARMLVRIFASVRELNPAGMSWLAAWRRFVAIVIPRTSWPGPPRSPP